MGIFHSFYSHGFVSAVMFFALSGLPSYVQGQWGGAPPATTGIGAGSGGIGEGSRFPFRVKLSGTLNPTTPKEGSLKVTTLVISGYRETYRFEIMSAEAIDDKQIPRSAIIPPISSLSFDFRLVGQKELMSKIGQSLPNTPVTLVGYLQQRRRDLILESVETISVQSLAPVERAANEKPPPAPAADSMQLELNEEGARSE